MEGGGSEGGGEEERRGTTPQEEGKYDEQPGGADEAAEDSGVTVLPVQEVCERYEYSTGYVFCTRFSS